MGKQVSIERIPSGQYHLRWWIKGPSGPESLGFTGTAAQIMTMLVRALFEDEANETINRQRKESAEIGAKVIGELNARR